MGIKDVKRRRPALDPDLILSELANTSSKWLDIEVFPQVESTNDLVISRLSSDAGETVFSVVADEQSKGRGRLQRQWHSPFGAGIALSVAIPSNLFNCQISAIPLLVGIAANTCLENLNLDAKLKWPNDLMIEIAPKEFKKIGGILVQRHDEHVVVGIGINVDLLVDELPTDNATSLALLGVHTRRESLIADLICELEIVTKIGHDSWLPIYLAASATLGTHVNVMRKEEEPLSGIVTNFRNTGALLLDTEFGVVEVTTGDVVQVRPAVH